MGWFSPTIGDTKNFNGACPSCNGSGYMSGHGGLHPKDCCTCGGEGRVKNYKLRYIKCYSCDGKGYRNLFGGKTEVCQECHGAKARWA